MNSPSEELKRLVRFTSDDAELVASLSAQVTPHFPRLVRELYERLLAHESTRRLLSEAEQLARLESAMTAWLGRLFGGVYDEAYFEASRALGRIHVDIGLPQRCLPAAMALVRSRVNAIVSEQGHAIEQAPRALDALSRIIDVDLAVMLDTYHDQLSARLRAEQDTRLSALGTLTAGLAHEIRNPLNGARLHVAFLERELAGRASMEVVDAIQVIDHEIDRLARLLSDFLDYAEPRPLVARPIKASTFAARCSALVAASAAARRVEVAVDLPPDEVTFEADLTRFERVIVNLLTNAIEALPPGGTTRLRLHRESNAVRFDVEDDGPGVPAGAPLFNPFYTTKQDGTGLGLSVAHRIVADHGGSIDFDSRPGRTVFRVELPMVSSGRRGNEA